jgi:hypothetical protein
VSKALNERFTCRFFEVIAITRADDRTLMGHGGTAQGLKTLINVCARPNLTLVERHLNAPPSKWNGQGLCSSNSAVFSGVTVLHLLGEVSRS